MNLNLILPGNSKIYISKPIAAYNKAIKIIDSVLTIEQYNAAENYCELYRKNVISDEYNIGGYNNPMYIDLKSKLNKKYEELCGF